MYNGKEDYSEGYIRAWWPSGTKVDVIESFERDIARAFDKYIPNEKGLRYFGGEARWFVMYKYDVDICSYILRNQDAYSIQDIEVRV